MYFLVVTSFCFLCAFTNNFFVGCIISSIVHYSHKFWSKEKRVMRGGINVLGLNHMAMSIEKSFFSFSTDVMMIIHFENCIILYIFDVQLMLRNVISSLLFYYLFFGIKKRDQKVHLACFMIHNIFF